jgi:sec-independent protein translocase protein TatC
MMALVPFSQSRGSRMPAPYDGLFPDASVLDLLDGFRKLLVRSAIAIAVGIVLGFSFTDRVVNFVLEPTVRALPTGSTLIYTKPGEAFALYVQIALLIGGALAMPYIMYQLWRLLTPLVPASARRFAIPFALFTTLGFVAGAAFTHFVAFPYMMLFFASFDTADLTFLPQLDDVFDLYMKMVLGMGVVFQMPTVVFFLAKTGLVTARFLWRSFRYAFLIIFVAAAVITPTGDMVTQTIFAAPMIGLYLLSILIAWMFGKPGAEPNDPGVD